MFLMFVWNLARLKHALNVFLLSEDVSGALHPLSVCMQRPPEQFAVQNGDATPPVMDINGNTARVLACTWVPL